jgi:hypothetical protein
MNTVITVMAILMVADALFTLLNLSKVESLLLNVFPNLNVKKLAVVEGLAGGFIIILKISTGSVS